jgi:hypothetical protein
MSFTAYEFSTSQSAAQLTAAQMGHYFIRIRLRNQRLTKRFLFEINNTYYFQQEVTQCVTLLDGRVL